MRFFNILIIFVLFIQSVYSDEVIQAIRGGDPEELIQLLKSGKDPNETETMGTEQKTALMISADQSDVKMAEILLNFKANPNFKTEYQGNTALMYLASLPDSYGDSIVEIAKLLLNSKADIHAKDKSDKTALHYYVENGNNPSFFKLLLENKANLNLQDFQGATPLFYATTSGNIEITEALLQKGASTNLYKSEQQYKITALHNAVDKSFYDIVKLFIKYKCDINIRTKGGAGGQTALMKAIENRDVDMVKILIEGKANVNAKDDAGYTTAYYATLGGGAEMNEIRILLKKAGAK